MNNQNSNKKKKTHRTKLREAKETIQKAKEEIRSKFHRHKHRNDQQIHNTQKVNSVTSVFRKTDEKEDNLMKGTIKPVLQQQYESSDLLVETKKIFKEGSSSSSFNRSIGGVNENGEVKQNKTERNSSFPSSSSRDNYSSSPSFEKDSVGEYKKLENLRGMDKSFSRTSTSSNTSYEELKKKTPIIIYKNRSSDSFEESKGLTDKLSEKKDLFNKKKELFTQLKPGQQPDASWKYRNQNQLIFYNMGSLDEGEKPKLEREFIAHDSPQNKIIHQHVFYNIPKSDFQNADESFNKTGLLQKHVYYNMIDPNPKIVLEKSEKFIKPKDEIPDIPLLDVLRPNPYEHIDAKKLDDMRADATFEKPAVSQQHVYYNMPDPNYAPILDVLKPNPFEKPELEKIKTTEKNEEVKGFDKDTKAELKEKLDGINDESKVEEFKYQGDSEDVDTPSAGVSGFFKEVGNVISGLLSSLTRREIATEIINPNEKYLDEKDSSFNINSSMVDSSLQDNEVPTTPRSIQGNLRQQL